MCMSVCTHMHMCYRSGLCCSERTILMWLMSSLVEHEGYRATLKSSALDWDRPGFHSEFHHLPDLCWVWSSCVASLPQFPYLTHKGSNSSHLMESPCCEDYLRSCVCLWPRQVCSVTINCCSCYYWCYFTLGCIPRGNFKAESGLFTGGSDFAREAQSTASLMSSRLHRGDLCLPSNSVNVVSVPASTLYPNFIFTCLLGTQNYRLLQ